MRNLERGERYGLKGVGSCCAVWKTKFSQKSMTIPAPAKLGHAFDSGDHPPHPSPLPPYLCPGSGRSWGVRGRRGGGGGGGPHGRLQPRRDPRGGGGRHRLPRCFPPRRPPRPTHPFTFVLTNDDDVILHIFRTMNLNGLQDSNPLPSNMSAFFSRKDAIFLPTFFSPG